MANKVAILVYLYIISVCVSSSPILQSLENEELTRLWFSESFKFEQLNSTTSNLKNVISKFNKFPTAFDGKQIHPDWNLNTVKLIKQHGYPAETHTVTTKDGYILDIYRIPNGKNSNYSESTKKQAVLLVPGILCSSADWVLNGPEKALAYLLAEEGYDVWLANPRGTTYSRKHTRLNPDKDKEFWNFSYHEIGLLDLPTIIDYILEQTQQPDLYYIGHSQGTTTFFVMASELPEYNKKIRLMSALAPVTYSSNIKNPFVPLVLPHLDKIMEWTEKQQINELFGHSFLTTFFIQSICNDDAPTQPLCPLAMFLIAGFDAPQLNKTMIPVIFSNFPAGASAKQFWHLLQGMRSDNKFQQYDYGSEENLIKYGEEAPPDYDVTKVTARIALHYSENDWLSSDKDVRKLISLLPNVVRNDFMDYRKFNHLDFLWATDAKTLLYDDLIAEMKKF